MLNSILRTSEAVTSTQAVALRDVRKVYGRGDGSVVALDGVTVGLARGSFTALMGPSGSGKSTFLNVAAGLDGPTSGTLGAAASSGSKGCPLPMTMALRDPPLCSWFSIASGALGDLA
jgi:ABC-type nitrate/sulfonate/bicarbonate transport system ATPase subunit